MIDRERGKHTLQSCRSSVESNSAPSIPEISSNPPLIDHNKNDNDNGYYNGNDH